MNDAAASDPRGAIIATDVAAPAHPRRRFPFALFALLLCLDVSVFLLEKYASTKAAAPGLTFFRRLFTQLPLWGTLLLKLAQLLTWTKILSTVDISFAFPLSQLSYPLAMLAATIVLHEHLSLQVWIGAILILLGAAMLGHSNGSDHADVKATT
jgi:drug/metabolite transporter (DMT)-like permease